MSYWPEAYFAPVRNILDVDVQVEASNHGVIGMNVAVEQEIVVTVTAEEAAIVTLVEVE